MRNAKPRQRLRQGVLERGRLEAELLSSTVQHVSRGAPWIGSVRAGSIRQMRERHRVQPRRLARGVRDAFDETLQADAFESGVIRLMRQVLAQVACKRACIADVLHPRQAGLPLVGLGRHQERSAVFDPLDVGGDPERVIRRAEHRRRTDHRPGQIALARQDRLAPPLPVHVVECLRHIPGQSDEIFFAGGPAVQVRVHARRDEDIPGPLELARDGVYLARRIAGEVEQHVRFDLCESALELFLVRAVERDVAGECPVGPILAARGDGLHAAPHELFARGHADETGAAQHQRPGHGLTKCPAR